MASKTVTIWQPFPRRWPRLEPVLFATGTEVLQPPFTDALCIKAGCNRDNDALSQTDSYWSVDLALHHELSDSLSGFVKLENATDERAIVSRQPDGARPNKPQFDRRFRVAFLDLQSATDRRKSQPLSNAGCLRGWGK